MRAFVEFFTPHGELAVDRDDAGRFVPPIVATMVFLATLALAAALASGSASSRWERDLAGSATVQVAADAGGRPLADRVRDAVQLLIRTPGVTHAQPLTSGALAELLSPWLGDAALSADLPMPRLIDVAFDPEHTDVARLREQLAAQVPGAQFDDHRRWSEGLRQLARSVEGLGLAIVAIVAGTASMAIVFAVRSGLAVHREVIELLHLIGARDSYIAAGFARQALFAALRGGLGGTLLALFGLLLLSFAGRDIAPGMLPALTLGFGDWALLAIVPVAVALLAGLTAHRTVMRSLAAMP